MKVSELVNVINKGVMFEVYESNGASAIFDSVKWNSTSPGTAKVIWENVKDREVEEFNIFDTDEIFIFVKQKDR